MTQKGGEKAIETSTIDQSGGNKLVHEEETENIEHNNDRLIFTFCTQFDERSINSNRKLKEFISRATMKRKPSRVYNSIRGIAEFERAETPSAIEEIIKRVFVSLKGKGQYTEKDYNDFRNTVHFQLQKRSTEKSNDYFYKCILAVDAREVIRMSFDAAKPMFRTKHYTIGREPQSLFASL